MIDGGILQETVSTPDGSQIIVSVFYTPNGGNTATEAITNLSTALSATPHALEANNLSSQTVNVVAHAVNGTVTTIPVPPGVSTRTANQLKAIGIQTRADAAGFELAAP